MNEPEAELRQRIEALAADPQPDRDSARAAVSGLLDALEAGVVRAASAVGEDWQVHAWVKQGILLGFRVGANEAIDGGPSFHFRDRDLYTTWDPSASGRDVRIVPGGSTVRRGAFLAQGVVMMPPAYVNVGAYVGQGSMIDSHALVGSCAQIGAGVHLSAAVQIGGVLEPIGAAPVVIEDGAFLGGGCGVYEGVRVGAGAVIAPGTVLTASLVIHDLVRETVHRAEGSRPLTVPAGAVVVPGTRPARGEYAKRHGLQLSTPVIVKYRDRGTDAALALEDALR